MIGIQALNQTHSKAPRAPLASHPAFAPMMMVWFAALLGLSVLAVEGAWLERWVMAMKIDHIIPAAAPPLGAKARLLLALAFGLLGAGLGWLVARVLRPAPVSDGDDFQLRQRDRHPDAPARRPISAHAELGDEGLGRASSAWDDMSPFHAEEDMVRDIPEIAPRAMDPAQAAPFAPQPFVQPFQTSASPVFAPAQQTPPSLFAAVQSEAPLASLHAADPLRDTHADSDHELYALPTIDFSAPIHATSPLLAAKSDHEASPVATHDMVTAPLQPDAFDEGWHALPPVVSDTDLRTAPSPAMPLAAVLPIGSAASLRAVDTSTPVAAPAKPFEIPTMIGATPVHPRASAGERIAHATLGDLSHVELIERLALAIHAREKKTVPPVAVNDRQDAQAAPREEDEIPAPQASLRSALAGLREVK